MIFARRVRGYVSTLSASIVIATLFVITNGIFFHEDLSLSTTLRFVVSGVVIATLVFEFMNHEKHSRQVNATAPDVPVSEALLPDALAVGDE